MATTTLTVTTHIKNGRSFKQYFKFIPTIHINPNSYSFRIMIIVHFFIQWMKI